MRLVLGVLTSVFLLSSIPALASTELLNPTAVGPDDLPTIRVVSSTESGLVLDFELPVLSVEELRAGERSFLSAAIPGGGLEGNPGQPAIPTFTRFLAIPDRAGVNVSARREGEVEVEGFPLVPMQEDDEQAGFAFDGAAYGRQGYGEEPAVSVGAPAISRELRLVPITFRPVRYDPSRQSLSVASTIRVEVSFQGSSEENVKTRHHRSIPPSFARMYQELVINHEQALRGLEVRPGSWILVCGSDTNLTSRLQPLVDWRMREGYKAVMVTTAQIGSTNSAIKSYIQEAYDTWEDPPEYVVIAGDAYGGYPVPTWFEDVSGYHGEGDHPYVQLEGNDVLADAHVGRLSFSSLTELETIVAKILGYERTPDTSDPGWFTRACLVGDPYDSGYSTVQVQQWIKIRLRQLGYAQIDTVFNSPFVSQMATAMNRGDTIFCYRGIQGMSGWSNTNTYNLTNGWKMPFVVTITCDTGSFYSTNSCRSEAFLRAGSATSPKAAIGAIGTATTGTHTRYNNCITYGIYYGLLYEGAYNLGAALTRGKMEMFLNYQLVDPNHVTIWSHWNNLMGDPAVPCWTAFPEPLQVTAPSSIPAGANSVTVTVRENGLPSEGAQVCLWKGTETHAVGVTDAQGIVEIPITTATPGDMLLTVTKHDRHAYEQTIPVVNQNRYVALAATALDDDATGESNGNGDAKIEPGETVELRVQLRNFGPQTANDVTAQLTCDDPRVQVIDDSETFGNIPGGGSAWCADDFDFRVDTICQDGVTLRFGIDVTSGSDHWHSMLELPVVSADLVWDGTIELSNVGGNAQMDPGETGQLAIRLVNQGGFPASSITAMLLSLSEFVDVPDGDGAFPAIPVDGNGMNSSNTFAIHAAADCFQGYEARLQVILSFNGGATDTTEISLPIGTRSTDDPTGPDAYGYYAFDDTDVAYPEAPVYSWVELDPAYGGTGTEVVLGDNGDYQDKSRVVDVPFPFQYYGDTYTRATICSNGWLAMGATYNHEYRNWTIPGAGGPEAMIAPFWDDLSQYNGGKVFQRYDQANHRWIIEWSHMRNMYNYSSIETFEAILYDPAFHETETGDGIIEFHYNTIANVDAVDGYATVGIENKDQSVGLLYTFFNRYGAGAANLGANRAIRFVPTREVLYGVIHGVVRNASADNIPLSGAAVTVLENGHEYHSIVNGTYQANEMPGVYTLVASHSGFEPDTVEAVQVTAGGTVQIDFALTDVTAPSISTVTVPTTNDTIGPYAVHATIQDGSPLDEASVYYRIDGGAFTQLTMNGLGGVNYRGYIPGQSWGTKVEFYVLARDAGDNEATDPPEAPQELFTFYVAPTVTVFLDDMEADHGWTIGSADDDADTGIWERVDPNGTWSGLMPVQPEDDHTPDPGANAWITGQSAPGDNQTANDVDGGRTTLTTPILPLSGEGVAILRYHRWFTNDTGTGPREDPWIVQITDDDGQTWHDLENTRTSDRSWRLMEFDLSSIISYTGLVRVRFIASDEGTASIVEAGVDDVELIFTGIGVADAQDDASLAGVSFALSQNQPNPFNPRTTIRFSLERAGATRLSVFDVTGREVRRLVDGSLEAGSHAYTWDGRDDAGHSLPSGIYLYRLEAGSDGQTRKMLLLE